jgi:type I restriction enzyme, S subunit
MKGDRVLTANSQVPEGYKQTEVGVIPEDWDAILLDQISIRGSGHTPDKKVQNYWNGDIKWISLKDSDQLDTPYIFDTCDKVTKAGIANSSAVLHPAGTVVLSRDAGVGKSSIMFEPMAVSQHFMAWQCGNTLNNLFLYYWLQSKKGEFERIAIGSTIKTIGLGYFKALNIPHPSIAEQNLIASALSDTDALIESLEQLLAKKRQIKQGAMQELFKPKAGWDKKCMGDVLAISHGRSQHEVVDENGDYPILASGGQIGRAKKYLYNKPSVLIGRKGTIDKPQYMDSPFWTVDTLFYSVVYEPNDAKYLFYQFCLISWRDFNEASGVPSLNARTIENIEIQVPSPEEQTAIAAILSDMDLDIEATETKLTKARQLKQGMMHELLTGRIRLIEGAPS